MHERLRLIAEVPTEAEADNPNAREEYAERVEQAKQDPGLNAMLDTLLANRGSTRHDGSAAPPQPPSIRLRRGPT